MKTAQTTMADPYTRQQKLLFSFFLKQVTLQSRLFLIHTSYFSIRVLRSKKTLHKNKTSKTTFNNGLPQVKQDSVKPRVTRWNCSICQNSSMCCNCSICSLLKITQNCKKRKSKKKVIKKFPFFKIYFFHVLKNIEMCSVNIAHRLVISIICGNKQKTLCT